MPRMLSLVQAGLLICNLAASPALAQGTGDDPDGPPPAAAQSLPPGRAQSPGHEQSPGQAQPPGQAQRPGQPHANAQRFIQRFQTANTTGDGRLTLVQAQAGHMPMIVRNFDAIDAQHKGYVTLQDVRAFRQQTRAMREGGSAAPN